MADLYETPIPTRKNNSLYVLPLTSVIKQYSSQKMDYHKPTPHVSI